MKRVNSTCDRAACVSARPPPGEIVRAARVGRFDALGPLAGVGNATVAPPHCAKPPLRPPQKLHCRGPSPTGQQGLARAPARAESEEPTWRVEGGQRPHRNRSLSIGSFVLAAGVVVRGHHPLAAPAGVRETTTLRPTRVRVLAPQGRQGLRRVDCARRPNGDTRQASPTMSQACP